MNIVLRNPSANEWNQIQSINNEVFLNDEPNDSDIDMEWPFSDEGVKYYKGLADGSYGHCIVAEKNGEIVGYVALCEKDFGYRTKKYLEIENIGVTSSLRSQGIGKLLMDSAQTYAKKIGADKLFVEAYWGNLAAVKYYKANGFVEIGIQLEKKVI